jgi:hypothetical protein
MRLRLGRAHGLGLEGKEDLSFPEIIYSAKKQFQKSLVNVYNAQKILRKYPKF